MKTFLAALLITLAPTAADGTTRPLDGVRRVVFVGDSITYAGGYIEDIEAYLRLRDPKLSVEFLNLGLPSETVSGLSEPGHAGGAFPRPDLHERFERILSQTRPDLVVAFYGMNDGIYAPFDEARFAAYRDGIAFLRDRATAHGAKVLHLTPPVFDPEPIRDGTLPAGLAEYRKPFVGYDDVLTRYSTWLLSKRKDGWDVVDIHGPLAAFLTASRTRDAGYRLANDGVHLNPTGHQLIAREVLRHWGVPTTELIDATKLEATIARMPRGPEVLELVRDRQRFQKDAWLTAVGHKRPGMKPGIPLDRADRKASEIEAKTREILKAN